MSQLGMLSNNYFRLLQCTSNATAIVCTCSETRCSPTSGGRKIKQEPKSLIFTEVLGRVSSYPCKGGSQRSRISRAVSNITISNRRRTSFSDSPLYLEVSVDEETLKNVVLHSVATALARSVFPVPGGPTISTPCRSTAVYHNTV